MLLLVQKAYETLLRYTDPHIGRLVSPRHFWRVADTAALGTPWAADNDAYSGFDEAAYRGMVDAVSGLPGCLFVSAPDVVGDAGATLDLFEKWHPVLSDADVPIGFVLQDGCRVDDVPWTEIKAVFIGGTSEWKYDLAVREIGAEAIRRGVWFHCGRVNSIRRITYMRSIGVDSIDGTQFSMFSDRWIPWVLPHLSSPASTSLAV